MSTRLLSVVMPTHDRSDKLLRAARSVLDQQGAEIELVIVDDASSDDTPDVTSRLAEDPRVRVVRNEVSLGPSGTRNAGIAIAQGEFLGFVDDDDALLPGAAATMVEALEADPDIGAAAPWYRVVHERQGRTAEFRGPIGYGAEQLLWFNFVGIPFGVIRRSLFAQDIAFDPLLPVSEDWDVWLRCAQERPFAVVQQSLYSYHQHGGTRVTQVGDDRRSGFQHFLATHASAMTSSCRTYHEAVIAGQTDGRSAIGRVLASAGRHSPGDAALAAAVMSAGYAASTIGTSRGDPGLPSRFVYRVLTTPTRHPMGTR